MTNRILTTVLMCFCDDLANFFLKTRRDTRKNASRPLKMKIDSHDRPCVV